ncbi:response regulator [Herminiimonas sp. NPDC097707]|uniref:response regulator n=1 Tax=Herminiimonas sp. NPDC097707 TaxID=3364007 RepID=UPI00383B88A9
MSFRLPFTFKTLTSAQRHRIARRRERYDGQVSDTHIRTQLLDHIQHTINTQMNGIIGALEMIRKDDLPSDQCEMINLAQSSADTLLADIGQLLDLDVPHPVVNDAARKSLAGTRMMVVGADALARARIEEELQQHDVRIDGFGLPNAALAALEKAAHSADPYRIALLEQYIPGIDGETLGTAIGNAALHRDTLLVLISDEHNRHDAERLTHAGFSAWLPQAAPSSMLINTLDMLCGCIVKKDAPRFVCAGVRLGAENTPLKHPPLFTHCRILVVDDNAVNLQVAQQMLGRFGCKIDTAKSGAQALLLSGEQHYDLILMDCQMPQMDGYQTTALLRAAENADTHAIIIGWSAGINRNERDTCLAIGMDDFISKPMRMRALNDMLMRWLHSQPVCGVVTLQQDDELEATQQMFGADFIELAQLFLKDSPKRLAHLQEVSAGKDAIAIAKLSHVLCGSSASIGASALAALCRELEIRAKNNELDDAPSHFHAIACEYARIDAKLHSMLNTASHAISPNKH